MSRPRNAVTDRAAFAVLATVLLLLPSAARASEDSIDTERMISEVLQDERLQDAKARGDFSRRDSTPERDAEKKAKDERKEQEGGGPSSRFAILPQIGYSPEKGGNGGIKLTDRDLFGLTLDISALAAQQGQAKAKISVIAPQLLDDWLILAATGRIETDPTKRFFGLGNNDVGPDALTRNGQRHIEGRLSAAVRVTTRFSLVVSGAYKEIRIRRGSPIKGDKDVPATTDVFPNLVGIRGGRTSPISAAIVFDDRDDVTRPIRGWNVIAKAAWVPEGLHNDFDFERYTFEASYLYPLLTRRQVLGVRVAGEYLSAARRQAPFWELASLGGGDDMRGYFLDRFLGKGKVIGGAEYRLKIFDFNFFDIWDVKIDGVGFGDAGRVFMTSDQLAAAFGVDETALPKLHDTVRFSYGGGVRFALGEATIARVDVGFSDEETGLVYLVFGHTF